MQVMYIISASVDGWVGAFDKSAFMLFPWLSEFRRDFAEELSISEIERIFEMLDKEIRAKNFPQIDFTLRYFENLKTSYEAKASILSYTKPIRDLLWHWLPAHRVLTSELKEAGLDVKAIMAGI